MATAAPSAPREPSEGASRPQAQEGLTATPASPRPRR
eukprot:CAMPEP_0118853640 /NCGR_PEP_ID=MMETSP1163-20130328/2151_1 /TAXON_ID=124430 /ORGANISM="Phaeomonas parva, Strain CCMP2877" /LENGTH=36 /DNA_ID= /DNA_START= /DNA_END= /DNA_ORIENTATION=